jgi:hypothetical protein
MFIQLLVLNAARLWSRTHLLLQLTDTVSYRKTKIDYVVSAVSVGELLDRFAKDCEHLLLPKFTSEA